MKHLIFLFIVSLCACKPVQKISVPGKFQLKFIGKYVIPYKTVYENTRVGGLSGIDYDSKNDLWYILSDDPSMHSASRFYTAQISISPQGIDTVIFLSVNQLLQPGGAPFPGHAADPYQVADPESIRLNLKTGGLVWSSEGVRILNSNDTILNDPFIYLITKEGHFTDSFFLPANMHMSATRKGPRPNGVFEGLSFDRDYKKLFVSMEEPLFQDGERAGIKDSSAWARIIQFDVRSRKTLGQYGYKLEPVKFEPIPADAFRVNGISEILYIGDGKMLVLERAFSTGRRSNTIRLFLADLKPAGDISKYEGLHQLPFHSISKKLLLDMDTLGFHIDNIEGFSFGPLLPNGNRSLVFVSDNNFADYQETQFLLFEIF